MAIGSFLYLSYDLLVNQVILSDLLLDPHYYQYAWMYLLTKCRKLRFIRS